MGSWSLGIFEGGFGILEGIWEEESHAGTQPSMSWNLPILTLNKWSVSVKLQPYKAPVRQLSFIDPELHRAACATYRAAEPGSSLDSTSTSDADEVGPRQLLGR